MKKLDLFFLVAGIAALAIYIVFYVNIPEFEAVLVRVNVIILSAIITFGILEVVFFSTAFSLFLKTASVKLSIKRAIREIC